MATWQENSAFKSRLRRVLLALGLAVMAAQSFAKPAAWYRWASKMTDHRVCAQTWFREPIAFTDSGCSIRVKPF